MSQDCQGVQIENFGNNKLYYFCPIRGGNGFSDITYFCSKVVLPLLILLVPHKATPVQIISTEQDFISTKVCMVCVLSDIILMFNMW